MMSQPCCQARHPAHPGAKKSLCTRASLKLPPAVILRPFTAQPNDRDITQCSSKIFNRNVRSHHPLLDPGQIYQPPSSVEFSQDFVKQREHCASQVLLGRGLGRAQLCCEDERVGGGHWKTLPPSVYASHCLPALNAKRRSDGSRGPRSLS